MRLGSRLTQAQRACIGSLAGTGPNIKKLARSYKVGTKTIARWLEEGAKKTPGYSDAAGRGRKPTLTQPLKNEIRKLARRGLSAVKISSMLSSMGKAPVSASTVRRVLHDGKAPMQWEPTTRGKVLSEKNRKERLQFLQSLNSTDFTSWVFMDAKDAYLFGDSTGHLQWRWQDEENRTTLPTSQPFVFRFYAAVAAGHKSKLYFVPPSPHLGTNAHKSKDRYTADDYVAMMKELTKEVQGWQHGSHQLHIVQDNARQHTAKRSKLAATEGGWPLLEGWPAQSWDLNIIENVWGVMNNKLLGSKARTTHAWRTAIENAWTKVDITTINKLVKGMGARVEAVVEARGAWLPHR